MLDYILSEQPLSGLEFGLIFWGGWFIMAMVGMAITGNYKNSKNRILRALHELFAAKKHY